MVFAQRRWDEERERATRGLRAALALVVLVGASLVATGGASPAGAAPPPQVDENRAREISRPLFVDALAARGNCGKEHGFTETSVQVDDLQMTHVRVRQTHNGVPVWGGEAIAHLNADGSVASVTDEFIDVVTPEHGPRATVTGDQAVAAAQEHAAVADATLASEPDQWIFRHGKADSLAWRVRLIKTDGTDHPTIPVVFVDASRTSCQSRSCSLIASGGSRRYQAPGSESARPEPSRSRESSRSSETGAPNQ